MPADIYYEAAGYILGDLGITPTPVNINLLVAWEEQEYTADELAVTNNPLATSLRSKGAGGYCTLPNGERSSEPCYDTLADGAAACAATIANGLYPHLLQGLADSDVNIFFSDAGFAELKLWSSSSTYASHLESTYYSLPSPPSWALPAQSPTQPTPPAVYYPPPVPPPVTPYVTPAPAIIWPFLAIVGGAALLWYGIAELRV